MQPNILIVDDVPDNIRVIASILKSGDYRMSFAMDGHSALETAMETPFDLILLDVMMPHMNGFEVCARLRQNADTRHIPIIFVTAKNDQESIVQGFNVGGMDYITKPFNSQELLARIDNQISLKRAMDEVKLADEVFQSLSEGVVVTNSDRRVLRTNPAFTQITGYTVEEVIGQIPSMFRSQEMEGDFHKDMWAEVQRSGCWQGELKNRKKTGEPYHEELSIITLYGWKGRAQNYVGIFSDITKRKQAEELIKHQAHHDALTGMPNRTLFRARLDMALRFARDNDDQLALMFIDLDGFKQVNDRHGHEFGDLVLKESARRLQESMRSSDLIARFGGDEFVAILPAIKSRQETEVVARKIIDVLEAPITDGERTGSVSASIGIACYPKDAQDGHALVGNADEAMYGAKQAGKGCAVHFEDAVVQGDRSLGAGKTALKQKS